MFAINSRVGITSGLALAVVALSVAPALASDLSPIEELGAEIFFDEDLSINQNQSCASCHGVEEGFTGPESDTNEFGAVYEGSIAERFGNRKPPSAAYATLSPILHYVLDKKEHLYLGGNFWNGRATGERLGNPAADQALGPFLNPLEQGLPDSACVVYRVCEGSYGGLFESIWGPGACDIDWPDDVEEECVVQGGAVALQADDREDVDAAYDEIGLSVAAYEASPEVNAFTSKYDYYLAGLVDLTKIEKKGLNFFKGKGKCDNCHVLDPGPNGEPPLLTDFTFDNLGVPRNPENPFYDEPPFNPLEEAWVDLGLGGFLDSRLDYAADAPDNYGKQKVPALRNVDKRPYPGFVKAFTHNGYFKSLKAVVHFYNTRDAKPECDDPFTPADEAMVLGCWPEPEVEANVNDDELGDLHLLDWQEDAIVEFLKTLSDGYVPKN